MGNEPGGIWYTCSCLAFQGNYFSDDITPYDTMTPAKKTDDRTRTSPPETDDRCNPLTAKEVTSAAAKRPVSRIATEFHQGFSFIRKYPKSVTVYGSARFKERNVHYRDARALAYRLSKLGYAIVTGGGPGIMEAANRGAFEAGGDSIGLNIKLPKEQSINTYVTDSIDFFYFFSRKTALSFSAEAYIFYPGGFGTLDEFFEIITLIQTKKIYRVPIILVGSDFWKPLQVFLAEHCLLRHNAIDKRDLQLYTITDDHEEIVRIVEAAPVRDGNRTIVHRKILPLKRAKI